jgi:flagellar basal body-associated protein FliL
LSIVIAALIVLVVVAIIAVPILIGVFGSASTRNPNRAEDEEDRARQERESGEQHR